MTMRMICAQQKCSEIPAFGILYCSGTQMLALCGKHAANLILTWGIPPGRIVDLSTDPPGWDNWKPIKSRKISILGKPYQATVGAMRRWVRQ